MRMLTDVLPAGPRRWASALVGGVLAALAATAALLKMGGADPLVAGLAVITAAWLAWLTFVFALAPLRAARAEGAQRHADAAVGLRADFIDTQSTRRPH